ncbi:hypothetical protein ACWD3I_33925 [Streptomyces sp. NPDC002817]|uniref:hypothetical protein n=1 Tax=Streptomyces sp. NPDC088357 TaxID=3154655 RepID=UPI003446AAA3
MTVIPYDDSVSHPVPLTFTWVVDADSSTASGACPVCHCAMTRVFSFGQALQSKGVLDRRAAAGPQPYHTACQCRTVHMGRPADERYGCGAMLLLAPPANGSTP